MEAESRRRADKDEDVNVPEGQTAGECFFGDFLCTSKESYTPSEGGINLSARNAITVNIQNPFVSETLCF